MAWTSPRTWVAGEVVTASLLNTFVRDNQLELNGTASAWTAYTPTLVNIPATITMARYKQVGKTVTVAVVLTVTGAVTGFPTVSLPVSAHAGGAANTLPVGAVSMHDNSAGVLLPAVVHLTAATTVGFYSSLGVALGATVPFTWASPDALRFTVTYEAA